MVQRTNLVITLKRIHVHDFHATLLAFLGIDHEELTFQFAGRDFRLTDVHGRVVNEIFFLDFLLPFYVTSFI